MCLRGHVTFKCLHFFLTRTTLEKERRYRPLISSSVAWRYLSSVTGTWRFAGGSNKLMCVCLIVGTCVCVFVCVSVGVCVYVSVSVWVSGGGPKIAHFYWRKGPERKGGLDLKLLIRVNIIRGGIFVQVLEIDDQNYFNQGPPENLDVMEVLVRRWSQNRITKPWLSSTFRRTPNVNTWFFHTPHTSFPHFRVRAKRRIGPAEEVRVRSSGRLRADDCEKYFRMHIFLRLWRATLL